MLITLVLTLAINLGTQCQDHVSSTFTSYLVVSSVVSQGLRTGFHVFWAGILGSLFGMISLAVWGLANAPFGNAFATDALPWLRVPLTMAVATYTLFLLRQFDNPAANTTAVFSALYVQLAAVPYPPMADYPTWAQVLVTRILALSTGVLAATLINVLVSGFFYSSIFRNQQYVVETQLVHALPCLLNVDFAGDYLFTSILGKINDAEAAMQELTWFSCNCTSMPGTILQSVYQGLKTSEANKRDPVWLANQDAPILFHATYVRLLNYIYVLKNYLQLSSLYSYTGKCYSRILLEPTIVNGREIEWQAFVSAVYLDTLQLLGTTLGWPPMQTDSKNWLNRSLTDKVFRNEEGKHVMIHKELLVVAGNKDWKGPKNAMVRQICLQVLSEYANNVSEEDAFSLIHPAVQGLIATLDLVVDNLLSVYEFDNMKV